MYDWVRCALKEIIITSLYEELKKYGDSDHYPYHMPGHKRKETDYLPKAFSEIDITEIDGFDNLHNPEGIIKEAQEFAAKAVGADRTYFLVGGSTSGVLAAISAAVKPGGKIIIVRNAHKSAYNAIGLRGIKTAYVFPKVNEELGFVEAVTSEGINEAIKNNPDASAVFIVSPTYEGRIAKVREIAKIVHDAGLTLIVDEAHGAHLPFAKDVDGYGESAISGGADIVIQSAHKTLPAPTQTALLHVNGNRVDVSKIERYLHIYQTSSPSYPLMAGLDGSVRLMADKGAELLKDLRGRYNRLVSEINEKCKAVGIFNPKDGVQDIGKCVISVKGENVGKQLADILREKYHLETEMCGEKYVLAMFTVFDGDEAFDRMRQALFEIDEDIESLTAESDFIGIDIKPEILHTIAEVWEVESEDVPLDKSEGRVAAEFVNLYPPGTPLLVPGEKITKEIIDLIKRYKIQGLNVIGLRDGDISVEL
jgi:arginine/lysine/ornithine decarboxylase